MPLFRFLITNLRAAIAEALGKSPNTLDHRRGNGTIALLGKQLKAGSRDIRDLTGLQFAINLRSLRPPTNQVVRHLARKKLKKSHSPETCRLN